MRVWTIGHSTHSLDGLVALLGRHEIEAVADVRRFPRSRRHPHFNDDALAEALPAHGVAYGHLEDLGGRRKPRPDSPNGGWRIEAFRGYADYTATDEFAAAFTELRVLAAERRTAIMCAEALWWRCHRRLVADQLVAAGDEVLHIGADGKTEPHELTDFARTQLDGALTYPPSSA